MHDRTPATATTPDRAAPQPAFPIAMLDLGEEIRQMRASPRLSGRLGKTLLRTPNMRIVLQIFDRGTSLPDHHADGALTIQPIDGRLIVTMLQSSFDIAAGQLLAIERGVHHGVLAIEDTAVLLTLAWHGPSA
jgi:quercetin dioxygenase-like cupin family protein